MGSIIETGKKILNKLKPPDQLSRLERLNIKYRNFHGINENQVNFLIQNGQAGTVMKQLIDLVVAHERGEIDKLTRDKKIEELYKSMPPALRSAVADIRNINKVADELSEV